MEILCQDILTVDLTQLAAQRGVRLQVVGNLPYYISSPILMHLFAHSAVIDRAVLMVQREVAERIVAPPGSSAYGLLSATTQMYATVENLFTLPPEAFAPPPEVYSTVFRLTMHSRFEELGVEPAGFLRFLRQIFALKRKTLANNLRASGYGPAVVDGAFRQCAVDTQVRAEALSLEGMACLFRFLTTAATAPLAMCPGRRRMRSGAEPSNEAQAEANSAWWASAGLRRSNAGCKTPTRE